MWTKLVIFLALSVSLTAGAKWTCPAQDIPGNPCYCINRNDFFLQDFSIRCNGSTTTQEHVNDYVTLISTLNDLMTVSPTPDFHLLNTNLTTFDVSIFNKSRFWDWTIHGNLNLKEITGSVGLDMSFRVGHFYNVNPSVAVGLLEPQGVRDNLVNLYWMFSNLGNYFGTPELETAFARMPSVTLMKLSNNSIEHLNAANFSAMTSLGSLYVSYNDMKSIEVNGLILPRTNNDHLTVSFQGGELNDDVISPFGDLETNNGGAPVTLEFFFNNFEFISAKNFEAFLNANPANKLDFYFNDYVICDSRMKWLKDGRDQYESQALNLDCSNDPGRNIFTTDLV